MTSPLTGRIRIFIFIYHNLFTLSVQPLFLKLHTSKLLRTHVQVGSVGSTTGRISLHYHLWLSSRTIQKVSLYSSFKKFIQAAYKITNSGSFSPVINLLFSFPSWYSSLSLNMLYLALEDGSPIFIQVVSHITLFIYFLINKIIITFVHYTD